QEPHDRKRPEARRQPRRHRERRPPDDDARDNGTRSDAIAQPAARHLEEEVGEREHAHLRAHLVLAEAELAADGALALRDADAIEIEQRRQGRRVPEQCPPRVRGRLGRDRRAGSDGHWANYNSAKLEVLSAKWSWQFEVGSWELTSAQSSY